MCVRLLIGTQVGVEHAIGLSLSNQNLTHAAHYLMLPFSGESKAVVIRFDRLLEGELWDLWDASEAQIEVN